jgi:hypothetical protein
MSEHDAFARRGRGLEEEYFRKKDHELVEKLKKAAVAEKDRAELSRKSGIQDVSLLIELQELGFTPETIVLLPIVPILEMAWVDGITPAERSLLLQFARSRDIEEGSAAYRQLDEWLSSRPAAAVFERAGRLIAAVLTATSGEIQRGLTADKLVDYCVQIAQASGGIFGLRVRSVAPEEKEMLARIAGDLKGPQS